MEAIKELRDQINALYAEKTRALDELDARATTTERAVEDLQEKSEQIPIIDSNVGAVIESMTTLRSAFEQVSVYVDNAEEVIRTKMMTEFGGWRTEASNEIKKRTALMSGLLIIAVAIVEIIGRFI